MTIRQQGGIFGRNPTFNDVTAEGTTSLDGPVVINESGADADFRVESDTQANALFVDGTNGHVGVGIANPLYNFVVSNDGAEGLEIGPGYLGGRILFQNYNRATSAYVAAWEYASEYVWNIGGTEKMRLNTSGNLAMASGNGIDFSATSGTGTSELFSDYEEGNWTPIDESGAGLTFTAATGLYTKIGDTVHAWASVAYPSTADATGASIGGLPFSILNNNTIRGGGTVGYSDTANASNMLGVANSTRIALYDNAGGATTNAEMSTESILYMYVYKTN